MTANHEHTPTTEQIELLVLAQLKQSAERHGLPHDIDADRADFRRWLSGVEAAAEQRGEVKAFRKTQEIIAGFEHTIDEERERGDMINTGYLIQEIDTEIQDLMEGDDA